MEYGIKQPLRIYENLNHRNINRKGANLSTFKLLCPTNMLLPFQIKRDAGVSDIISIVLVNSSDPSDTTEIINSIPAADFDKIAFANHDYIFYFGEQEHSANINPGSYYLVIKDVENTWYSEDINFQDFSSDLSNGCALTKITYWDTCDIGEIFYRTEQYLNRQYKNILYLDVDIGKPEYEYEEEGDEDGLGNFSPEYKKSSKLYNLQTVCPEFFVDALSMLPMHIGDTGTVEILTSRGYTGSASQITVESEWQGELGVWSLTDIQFVISTEIKVGCCDSLDLPIETCIRTYTEFVAVISLGSNDYNNFEYTSASDGSKIPLEDNDLVMIDDNGDLSLQRYDSSAYNNPVLVIQNGDVFADINQLYGNALNPTIYYFFNGGDWETDPIITHHTHNQNGTNNVRGVTYKNTVIELWSTNGSVDIKMGTYSAANFMGSGIVYTPISGHTHIWVESIGINCDLGESNQSAISDTTQGDSGIGFMVIEADFMIASE